MKTQKAPKVETILSDMPKSSFENWTVRPSHSMEKKHPEMFWQKNFHGRKQKIETQKGAKIETNCHKVKNSEQSNCLPFATQNANKCLIANVSVSIDAVHLHTESNEV